MSKTAVAHPLVAGYLRQFDAAASILPMDRARELREQIVAHIEDAARPGASDEQIAAVLSGLGPARLLVAEAVAATGKRPWVSRVGWKGWTPASARCSLRVVPDGGTRRTTPARSRPRPTGRRRRPCRSGRASGRAFSSRSSTSPP